MPNQYTDPNAEPVLPPRFQAFATTTEYVVRDNVKGVDYPFGMKETLQIVKYLIDGGTTLETFGLLNSPISVNAYNVTPGSPDLYAA